MTPESLQLVARVVEEEMKWEASGTATPDRSRILDSRNTERTVPQFGSRITCQVYAGRGDTEARGHSLIEP